MTVLGLKLSRRANAVSALHGEVSRAMWTGLYPGKPEDEVPIGHITNGVHVPTWLAPQMFRLYDRHLGTGWHEHSGESRIWEGIENIDDGELWETHRSSEVCGCSSLCGAARWSRPQRRGESPETLQRLSRVLEPGCAHHRICAPLRHLQARQPDPGRYRKAGVHGERSQASGAVRLRRQGASARRTRQARAAADRGADARSAVRRQVRLRRGLRHQRRAATSCRAWMCG